MASKSTTRIYELTDGGIRIGFVRNEESIKVKVEQFDRERKLMNLYGTTIHILEKAGAITELRKVLGKQFPRWGFNMNPEAKEDIVLTFIKLF